VARQKWTSSLQLTRKRFRVNPIGVANRRPLCGVTQRFQRKKGKNGDPGIESIQTLFSLRRRIELLIALRARVQTNSQLREDLRDLAYV
jgi:hypothetical protein